MAWRHAGQRSRFDRCQRIRTAGGVHSGVHFRLFDGAIHRTSATWPLVGEKVKRGYDFELLFKSRGLEGDSGEGGCKVTEDYRE